MKWKTIVTLILIIASTSLSSSTSFDIVRPDKDSWVCVDYAVDYARNNPEWEIVSYSTNPHFQGASYMVNYRILDTETILIHDDMYNAEYEIHNWQHDGNYYHFWDNQFIKRNYRILLDNREMVSH